MAGLLTLEESAQRLRLPVDEVLRLVERRELFPLRDGPTLKFKPDEIERYAGSMDDLGGLDLDPLDAPPPASTSGSSPAAPGAAGGPGGGGADRPAAGVDAGFGALDISLVEPERAGGFGLAGSAAGPSRERGDSSESIFADSHPGAAAAEPGARLELDEVEGTAIFTSTPGLVIGPAGLSSPGGAASGAGMSSAGGAIGASGSGSPAPSSIDSGAELELDGSLMGESVLPLSEVDDDGLSLESIGGASSLAIPPAAPPFEKPSLEKPPAERRAEPSRKPAAPAASAAGSDEPSSPSLVLGDDSFVAPAPSGSGADRMAISGISDAAGLSIAGESGISLDDEDLEASGILLSGVNVDEDVLSGIDLGDGESAASSIDLGEPVASTAGDEDSVSLEDFDPVQVRQQDDETGSGIFVGDSSEQSSFYGDSLAPDASSFDGGIDQQQAVGGYEVLVVPGVGSRFGALQVVGLVCCTLLLLTGGLVCLDLVGAIGSVNGPRISAPLLDSLSQLFGWK
jgi:hypothetical protein